MTREQIYNQCLQEISKTNCLLLELPTGFGKTALSLKLCNYLLASKWYEGRQTVNILILVAKRVHKQTWKDEISKWGSLNHPTATVSLRMECYESLHKCLDSRFDIVISDEVHHIGSDSRLQYMQQLHFGYFIGLSATIPQKLKQWFIYRHHAGIVSCGITDAIDSDILPEPTILLFPLELENTRKSETLEVNAKAKGPVFHGEYKDLWTCKKQKVHAFLKCTQRQKLFELDKLIEWYKKKAMMGNLAMKQSWLYFCGKRLEFLADCKLQWVRLILHHLDNERTITFCKTIEQTEVLGKNCIHSQNKNAARIYEQFNQKKIDHITAVNILNENANLVDCKYAVFCNLSSSEVIQVQRTGRALRHSSPVIILPYYKNTREEEITAKMTEGFNPERIKTIHSISEI
jgi:superfamily II DNA or RNA helicase